MRLSFTGTRKGMTPEQKVIFRFRLIELNPTMLIHGGCIGADDDADKIAADLGIRRFVYPSNLEKQSISFNELQARGPVMVYAPLDPLVRNKRIVEAGDRLIAAPSSRTEKLRSGTWATVRYGRKYLGEKGVEIL